MVKKQLSFRTKVLLMVLASSIVLALVVSALFLKEYFTTYNNFIGSYKKSLYADFDRLARSEVEISLSMLQRVFERSQKGEITLDEAKKQGADLLRNIKYGQDGYIWADTTEGVNVVMLGKPIEGTNRFNLQDAKGKYLIQEIIKNGMQQDGGFTDYWYPKKDGPTPFPKRSYSRLFAPFGWVIGTGNYVDDIEAIVAKAAEENLRALKKGVYQILGATFVILIGISVISIFLTKRLLQHIGTEPMLLEDIAERVSRGDLTVSLDDAECGIYGAMKRMVENLRIIMERVNRSSMEVSAASAELQANARQTAENSGDVVSQAGSVSTASEEMAATSSEIANNCHMAVTSSEQASNAAQKGAEIVKLTVNGMNQIAVKVRDSAKVVELLGNRSEQIGEIVGTIEDIADQTNLLALNAAIEAARAGEQGRGFAVVADEVRALAERTTKATREIGEMIKNIQSETKLAVKAMEEGVKEVEVGTTEAAKSGEALEEILIQISGVTMQINQIATAAEEQTATTREITNNIQSISDVVQMSAKSSQEVSLAAAQLSELSEELKGLVTQFNT
ncbi:methyl-accepting chemotaxis protein [Geotalea uraniireducens]|uniref:Methyl-accepting chemotaxis sensory transducer n=1 Tax=Geotalea uraniireducens (strain Rf4) TaxID=351605 RepID=A5G5Z9_GEOUR|nr:methyl-accepting chemotaxis protein [Geotalea uraniireducens]ABQ27217.1 methyl-accepting chemotaxis sensory transducer [Geotalea uraniireducens Rf4]